MKTFAAKFGAVSRLGARPRTHGDLRPGELRARLSAASALVALAHRTRLHRRCETAFSRALPSVTVQPPCWRCASGRLRKAMANAQRR